MKYVRFWAETCYCGTETEEYEAFEDDITEKELDSISEDLTIYNAEEYEYLATGWDDDFEDDDERSDYYDDCSGGWNYVSKEEYLENTKEKA